MKEATDKIMALKSKMPTGMEDDLIPKNMDKFKEEDDKSAKKFADKLEEKEEVKPKPAKNPNFIDRVFGSRNTQSTQSKPKPTGTSLRPGSTH